MKKFLITLAAVICCALTVTVFASCSDDDNTSGGPYTYSAGFSKVEGSNILTEMGDIEDIFSEALNVEDCTDNFKYDSDAEVIAACKKAETTLNGLTIRGSYTLVVVNKTTNKTVFTWSN